MKKEYILIIYGVIAVIIIIFLTSILKKLGIFKSAEDKKNIADAKSINETKYFDPTYYKTVGAFKPIGKNMALTYAQKLKVATRGVGTDESMVYDVFNSIYNKTNISEIAEAYYLEYSGFMSKLINTTNDLKVDLLNDMSDAELSQLWDIINSLPEKT